MTLKDIISISGKYGLFVIKKSTKTRLIVETIAEKTKKMAVDANHRVSVLKDISIYVTTSEEAVSLLSVFKRIKKKHGDKVKPTTDNDKLKNFLEDILPEYNKEKVYTSDIRKIISWYNTLSEFTSQVFDEIEENKTEETSQKVKED